MAAGDNPFAQKLLGLVSGLFGKAKQAPVKAAPRARRPTPAAPSPQQASGTSPLKSPEEEAAESEKRMALISAYQRDPNGHPAFRDKTLVYRLLTAEREYQHAQIQGFTAHLEALPPGPQRQEMEERIGAANQRQAQLFILLKRVTGKSGKTGGTGFIGNKGSGEL